MPVAQKGGDMCPARIAGRWLVAVVLALACARSPGKPNDGSVEAPSRDTAAVDGIADRAITADAGQGDANDTGSDVIPSVPGNPLIECFDRTVTGCVHGVLESLIANYWESPYGQGPRFVLQSDVAQGLATVRAAAPMSLAAGTLYFWARLFDALEPGQTHVQVQVAMVDDAGQVDGGNRLHVLFRDGKLEGLVAGDTLQVGPLAERADWNRDVIAPGQWHQYALSWDARELLLFVDGGLLAHAPRSSPAGMTAAFPRVYVGARFDGTYAADSQIAHVLLWDQRLTHPDIQRLYLAELETVKLPIDVKAATDDGVKRDRVELPWAGALPVLDLHVTTGVPIGPGGRVLVGFGHSNGEFFGGTPWPSVTADLPAGVSGAVDCVSAARLPIAKVCTLAIGAGTVPAGSDVVLHLGGVPLGSKATIGRKDTANVWPRVFVDCGGDSACTGALLPVTTQPVLAFVPPASEARSEIFARLPSTVVVGEPFSLRLWAEKADAAPDLTAAFKVAFTAVPELSGLPASYDFVAGDDGGAELKGLVLTAVPAASGPLLAATTDAGETVNVNPVDVLGPASALRLYFGDLHIHTTISDGKEAPTLLYPFARSRGLDFAALSDHVNTGDVYATPWEFNHTMNAADWQTLQQLARTYNAPGAFVTFLGFEESAGSLSGANCMGQSAFACPPNEGDWNTYYSGDTAPLPNWDRVLSADGLVATVGAVDPMAVVIPHFGGRRADLTGLTVAANRARVPVVEVISNHTTPPDGASAWATQNLASDVRLGFIGSSDDHSSHPGRSMWQTRYGYMAAWASALDRASILDAIRKRHTYATSHADRPIVRVSANHAAMMGDAVTLAAGEDPAMTLTVTSRARVTQVSVFRNGTDVWDDAPVASTSSAPFPVSVSFGEPLPASPTSYYWRIDFDNGSAVWTSPVWFER
jgi:hypothetical protein